MARSTKLQSELASRSSELKGKRERLEELEQQERNAEEGVRRLDEQQVLSLAMRNFQTTSWLGLCQRCPRSRPYCSPT